MAEDHLDSGLSQQGSERVILIAGSRMQIETSPDPDVLRAAILKSIEDQGFAVDNGRIAFPDEPSKEHLRSLHAAAVAHKIQRARPNLQRYESRLLQRIASGMEVDPSRIRPVLVTVRPETEDELLFRYVGLHWSVPVSSGYGRRLRFLVVDEYNGKLIGVIGLGDPVFALGVRDRWIGWDIASRRERLQCVMDAFILGAVPPYSILLGGKLVAMLTASNGVRQAFSERYKSRTTVIRQRAQSGQLALVTTASAFGRSTLYNRVGFRGRRLFHPIGFTLGSGEFQFSNGLYSDITRFAARHCAPTAKQSAWGTGFRNRREVIRKSLLALGLSTDWLYHGVKREVYAIPLAANTREFLCGKQSKPAYHDHPPQQLLDWFMERWLLPRLPRLSHYREFTPESYTLWTGA